MSIIDDLRLLRLEWDRSSDEVLHIEELLPRRRATIAIKNPDDPIVVLAIERLPNEPPPSLPDGTGHLIVREEPLDRGGSWIEVAAPISYSGPFSALAAYGLNQARNAEPNAPQGLMKAIDELCDLFTRPAPPRLDTQRLAALYAELRVLEELVATGVEGALESWTGPNADPHDFTGLPGGDIEVKSTLSPDRTTIRVNGIEQLDRPEAGELLLLMMRLERDKKPGAERLSSLIGRIQPNVDEVEFLRKLADAGYDFSDTEDDDDGTHRRDPAFREVETLCYRVDAAFPRVVPDSLVARVLPDAVDRLRYVVELDGLPTLQSPWTENVEGLTK